MYLNLRTVVEQPQFRKELRRLKRSQKRADEFTLGLQFVLARNPECGMKIGDTDVWAIAMNEFVPGDPTVVFYTFNDQNVFLLSIKMFPV